MVAVPARHGWQVSVQPDGTQLTYRLVGDEFSSYYETTDGFRLRWHGGAFVYERLWLDGQGDVPAHDAALRSADEAARLENAPERTGWQSGSSAWRRVRRRAEQKDPALLRGEKRGLVILVEFKNQRFSMADPKAVYTDILNKEGYSEHGARGSVSDYFSDQSNGLLQLQFDVAGPYRLSEDYNYYGEPDETFGRNDIRAGEMIREACELADDDVDFSRYDWDGDGEADQVFVLYAGYGQASGGSADTVWPHEWTLSDAIYQTLTMDGTVIDTYACSCELSGGEGTTLMGIGTFCHEFSHCMGLPDTYDTNFQAFGMGDWDVMSHGNYNGGDLLGWCPAGYTAYEKMYCGWQEPIDLVQKDGVWQPVSVASMAALSEGGAFYRIVNPAREREFYMLENRQLTGWDSGLPGEGLLVTHIDYMPNPWRKNYVNSDATHQRVAPVHADNEALRTPESQAADTYPYEGLDSLTDNSTPRDDLYNANLDGERLLHIALTHIRQNSDGSVAFEFGDGQATGVGRPVEVGAVRQPVAVYDGSGKAVSLDSWRSGKLPNGLYLVRFSDGKTEKMLVNK